jgi:hypothetical protein
MNADPQPCHNADLYPDPESQKQYGVMRILNPYQAFTAPTKSQNFRFRNYIRWAVGSTCRTLVGS